MRALDALRHGLLRWTDLGMEERVPLRFSFQELMFSIVHVAENHPNDVYVEALARYAAVAPTVNYGVGGRFVADDAHRRRGQDSPILSGKVGMREESRCLRETKPCS